MQFFFCQAAHKYVLNGYCSVIRLIQGETAMRYLRSFRSKRSTLILPAAGSAVISCVVIGALIMVFGFFISKIDATDIIISAMSTFALCIGAFSGGYVSGKRRRKNGLIMGILCGAFVFMIVVLLSHFFSKAVESFSMPAKLVLTLICAGIGGVVGVNSKHGRF